LFQIAISHNRDHRFFEETTACKGIGRDGTLKAAQREKADVGEEEEAKQWHHRLKTLMWVVRCMSACLDGDPMYEFSSMGITLS